MEYPAVSVEEKGETQRAISKVLRVHKVKKKLILIASAFILILLIICISWLGGRSNGKQLVEKKIEEREAKILELEDKIRNLLNEPIVVSPVSPQIILDILNSEIGEIGELATVEYLFTDAARFTDSKQIKDWNIPFTQKSFMIKWNGVIKAGVNLEQVRIDVVEAEKKILVTIPSADILSYDIDENSIEVLDEKSNIFNPITIEDKVKFDIQTEDAMKNRAIENGLLEKAEANAENILSQLISVNPAIQNIYSVEIEFIVSE